MFCLCFVDHRDLHVLTHSFPTLRSSDLHLDPARAWLAAQYRLEIFLQRLFADLEAGGDVEGVLRLLIFLGIGRADIADQVADRCSGRIITREAARQGDRSEEHTSELQSLMRISYAVLCLTKKNHKEQQLNYDRITQS